MFPILQIGGAALQTPGLILLAGIWIGLSVAEKYAKLYKIKADQLYNISFAVLVAGILGARLSVMVRFPSAFIDNPSSIISLNPSLLDPAGGMAIALATGLVYSQRKKINLLQTLDALVPTLAVMGIAIPVANLAYGNAFGAPTNLPWGIELWGTDRHPSQIYQAIAGIVILWLVWPSRQRKMNPAGLLFTRYIILTAGSILLLAAFRGDSVLIWNGWRSEQIAAWIILAFSLWGYSAILEPKKS
ncbi:MAG: prolipoprotein diacylglyceryl transferase [Chloroflexi bacterium]|nr:prolipoprotein diacylglyceryl transferase [Chloroflexota bacterium]